MLDNVIKCRKMLENKIYNVREFQKMLEHVGKH
jgi:hypothetical protein